MAFRTVIIEKANKINLDLNNIVVYHNNEPYWINLDEISTIVIEDPRCLVSLRLLTEMCVKGINIILTNASQMPVGNVQTLYDNARASQRLKKQIAWDTKAKEYLWTKIVEQKIILQRNTLIKLNKTDKIDILNKFINELTLNDLTNREGLASRTYFKELFGLTFKRFNEDIINFSLNYAYQIIRSKIAQVIVSYGYNPSLGINHKSEYNTFNLADDFIEVYRPIVDYYVYFILKEATENYLTPLTKQKLVAIINERIIYNGLIQKLSISIDLYLQGMFSFLENGDTSKIIFPELQ